MKTEAETGALQPRAQGPRVPWETEEAGGTLLDLLTEPSPAPASSRTGVWPRVEGGHISAVAAEPAGICYSPRPSHTRETGGWTGGSCPREKCLRRPKRVKHRWAHRPGGQSRQRAGPQHWNGGRATIPGEQEAPGSPWGRGASSSQPRAQGWRVKQGLPGGGAPGSRRAAGKDRQAGSSQLTNVDLGALDC